MTVTNEVDWAKLEREYKRLRSTLEPIHLPSEREYEQYIRQAAIGREADTVLANKINLGYVLLAVKENYSEQVKVFNRSVESGDPNELESLPSIFDTIEAAIRCCRMSNDFMMAWGHLHLLIGRQHELLEQQDRAEASFERGVESGKGQTSSLQKAWYATWILAASGSKRSKRDESENELAEICSELWRGKRPPPAGFTPVWFEKLIVQENGKPVPGEGPCGKVYLKVAFTKLGWSRLARLADDVKGEHLPPLIGLEHIANRNP